MKKTVGPCLRHRVSFASRALTRDSNGDMVEVFVPVASLQNVPCEVLTGAGAEAVKSGQPVSSTAARILLRYQAALSSPYGLRVTHGDEVYHVETHYNDTTGRRWVTLVCSKGVADA